MKLKKSLLMVGPGIAIAATGVGAGDLVAAAVSGSRFGLAVIWVVALGALLKFALNEGLARWQLATGTTLLEAWVTHFGRWFSYLFLFYLVVWSFVVGGALISACGMGAHALFPNLSVRNGGILHSLLATAFVVAGGYRYFEHIAKGLIVLMVFAFLGCALFVAPPWQTVAGIVTTASVPQGSARFLLGVIGGVGGSLTLLVYGYWMREKKWEGRMFIPTMRMDLAVAYILTGVIGVALMVLAANTLHVQGVEVKGTEGVVQMATTLETVLGRTGYWTFVFGFWGAVFTSMLGVWQSVPYLFCDFVALVKGLDKDARNKFISTRSPWYRGYLFALAVIPMSLLYFDKPIFVILLYSVVGSLFMPFLAGTLLYLNGRGALVGKDLKNRAFSTILLILCLVLFGYLCVLGLTEVFANL